MNQTFAPGCALMIYKPQFAERILRFLRDTGSEVSSHLNCCRHEPHLAPGTLVINTCAGCDRRYREMYDGITTASLWEIIDQSDSFPFPDYQGKAMSIHDACPTRTEDRVYVAVRNLLEKMNIRVVEPERTRSSAICCGDSAYGTLPVERVRELMSKRAAQMACEDVVVYCISCIKAMHIGGRRPRYMVDLLFGEETNIGEFEPDVWHEQLQQYIDEH